jgi:hypothetical protein
MACHLHNDHRSRCPHCNPKDQSLRKPISGVLPPTVRTELNEAMLTLLDCLDEAGPATIQDCRYMLANLEVNPALSMSKRALVTDLLTAIRSIHQRA